MLPGRVARFFFLFFVVVVGGFVHVMQNPHNMQRLQFLGCGGVWAWEDGSMDGIQENTGTITEAAPPAENGAAETDFSEAGLVAELERNFMAEAGSEQEEEGVAAAAEGESDKEAGQPERGSKDVDDGADQGDAAEGAESKEGDDDSDEDASDAILDDDDDTDADEGEDSEADGEGDGLKKLPDWAQKRISKLAAQKREARDALRGAESERDALRSELEAAKAAQVVLPPSPADPFADVHSEAELEKRLATAKQMREWTVANPEGGAINPEDPNSPVYDAKQVSHLRARAEDMLRDFGPRRKEWLAAHTEAHEQAKKVYPVLFKEGTRVANGTKQVLDAVPELRRLPDFELVLGDWAVGALVRAGDYRLVKTNASGGEGAPAGQASESNTAKKKPAAPAAPSRSAPAVASREDAGVQAAEERFRESGSANDLAQVLLAKSAP